jgi:CheY-like chemotaxis protein
MNIDDLTKLIDAVTKLLGVLVWPGLLLFVLIRFGPGLKEFFSSLGEFTLKGAGFEASAKRVRVEAAAALVAAAASRAEAGATPETAAREAKAVAQTVAAAVTPRVIRRARRAKALWVDDHAQGSVHERQSLEALGIQFILSRSTEDAITTLKDQSFDVIISDMGRPPDPQAGFTLLDKLRNIGNHTPYIIYAGARGVQQRQEALRRGALGCTDRPDELFELALLALTIEA